jgi:hypothetical protein
MVFASTFVGLTVALAIWATAYAILSTSGDPALNALATHLEALSPGGWFLFVVLAIGISLLTYRLFQRLLDR